MKESNFSLRSPVPNLALSVSNGIFNSFRVNLNLVINFNQLICNIKLQFVFLSIGNQQLENLL